MSIAACGGGGGSAAEPPARTDVGARLSTSELVIERDVYDRQLPPPLTVTLSANHVPANGLWYDSSNTTNAVSFVGSAAAQGRVEFQVLLASPGVLAKGEYIDELSISLCTDEQCQQQVVGSPFKVTVRLRVGHYADVEPGLPVLAVTASRALAHDVVGAAYSTELDALVVASAVPEPAVHVHDLRTGTTNSTGLATTPTSIALAPGGRLAAVGHDGAVTLVELGPLTSRRLPVPQRVGNLLMDGQDRVWTFSEAEHNRSAVIELDAVTGATIEHGTAFYGPYGNAVPTLHPDQDRFYFSSRNVSPGDVYVARLGSPGTAPQFSDSPYHGEYEVCGRVWLSADGENALTACGAVFRTAIDPALHLRYVGTMTLSPPTTGFDSYRAIWIDAPVAADVVLLEQPLHACASDATNPAACHSHLATYDATTLALKSRLALPPVTVGQDRHAQFGRMAFTRGNGQRLLLSHLRGAEAAASMRLSTLP